MNSIGNERKEWYQLHGGIGCNWCTSSTGGAIDLEWNYLIECNWESKELMVSITLNRCNWCNSSIGGAIVLEWYYLFQFNWESKETMVSITWNRMQFMYFINWRGSNWSGMTEWQYLIQFNWESKETIGCNSWWTSSTIGRATDLEWYYLFQFNWEWRKETVVSITWNRMQLMYFINWLGEQLIWNEIISFNSIGNERNYGINYME